MDPLKMVKQILAKSTVIICDNVDPTSFLGKMEADGALTHHDVQLIECEKTPRDKSNKLLDILRYKETTAYDVFMDALKETHGQIYAKVVEIERNVGYSRPGTDPSSAAAPQPDVKLDGPSSSAAQQRDLKLDDMVKDSDIEDLIDEVTGDQLRKIYGKLDIPHRKVQQLHEEVPLGQPAEKARKVLYYWLEKEVENATRRKLLQALKDCEYNLIKLNLEKKWLK